MEVIFSIVGFIVVVCMLWQQHLGTDTIFIIFIIILMMPRESCHSAYASWNVARQGTFLRKGSCEMFTVSQTLEKVLMAWHHPHPHLASCHTPLATCHTPHLARLFMAVARLLYVFFNKLFVPVARFIFCINYVATPLLAPYFPPLLPSPRLIVQFPADIAGPALLLSVYAFINEPRQIEFNVCELCVSGLLAAALNASLRSALRENQWQLRSSNGSSLSSLKDHIQFLFICLSEVKILTIF